MPIQATDTSAEPKLLDFLVIIAEYWTALVLGPLFVAGLAYLAVTMQPVDYRGTVRLALTPDGARVVAGRTGAAIQAIGSVTVNGPPAGPAIITVVADTADMVTVHLNELVQNAEAFENSPTRLRQELEDSAAEIVIRIQEAESSLQRLNANLDRIEQQEPYDARAFATLAQSIEQLRNDRFFLQSHLRYLSDRADQYRTPLVISPPSEPRIATQRSALLNAILAALASGFVLLLAVFAWNAIRQSSSQPENAHLVERIKRALLFRRA